LQKHPDSLSYDTFDAFLEREDKHIKRRIDKLLERADVKKIFLIYLLHRFPKFRSRGIYSFLNIFESKANQVDLTILPFRFKA
jgi:hypothetical protein